MTQGELEKLALKTSNIFSELEIRIMTDIVRRIRINGFSTATSDAQMATLRRLGRSETSIKEWVAAALRQSDEELNRIFSDEVYREYYKHQRAYQMNGFEQIPLEKNQSLQQMIEAVKTQINNEYENITGSMGFALRAPDGRITYSPLMEYYRSTLDNAAVDIQTGGFNYASVLQHTITQMTNSGIRWVDYDSGVHNRVDVAARRAVMTGFRQVQAHINEQVAADLGTDSYEVSYHVGARPSHQPWQGRVWTKDQLISICGLGSVTGLCGANCYHDYNAFIPGVSVRTYTEEQLEQMLAEENTPKEYYGKSFTTYEALQEQRRMERNMRATRQQIKLLQEGEADEKTIILKKARYQGQCQVYKDFSDKMGLPQQKQRILQDGLRGRFAPTKRESAIVNKQYTVHEKSVKINVSNWKLDAKEKLFKDERSIRSSKKEKAIIYDSSGQIVFKKDGITHSVSFTEDEVKRMEGCVLTHNHPGGASLSTADIDMLRVAKLSEIRAVGRDGVYRMIQPDRWKEEISSHSQIVEEYNRIVNELQEPMEKWALDNLDRITERDYQIIYQNKVVTEFAKRFGLKYEMESLNDVKD